MMTQMRFLIYYYIHGSSNVFAFNDCKLCRQNAYKKRVFYKLLIGNGIFTQIEKLLDIPNL